MYNYYLYGLFFSSDIKLFNIPLTESSFSAPDIVIHMGSVDLDSLSEKSNFILQDQFSVIKTRFGLISVASGKEIVYSLKENCEPESITPFIVGWGIAFVLTQKGYSTFHCSALTKNNLGFFVSGVSGAGKSTTALELIKHGCKYLCDDMAIVNSYEDMMIPPAFPVQKVCPNITAGLEDNLLYEINNDRGKFSYLNEKDYCAEPKKLKIIFKLMVDDVPQVEVKELTGIKKYLRVLECLFFEVQYALSAFPDNEKFNCLKIAGNIRLYTITRPKDKNTVDEISNVILKILNEQEET